MLWQCFVEAAISAAVKVGKRRLDLSRRTAMAMGHAYGGNWTPNVMLEGACAATRLPPLLPEEVLRRLKHEKKFTAGSDVEVVDKLYRNFFAGITSHATRLDFGGLKWGAEEVRELAVVLPRFGVLEVLDLPQNKLGSGGALELAPVLEKTPQLTELK